MKRIITSFFFVAIFIFEYAISCAQSDSKPETDTVILNRDFGLPVCSIEKEYINSASGQLRTRFQAFVESVEIKHIQEGK